MSTKLATQKSQTSEHPQTGRSSNLMDFGLPSLNRLRQEFDQIWNNFYEHAPALWNAEKTDLRWSFHVADQSDEYVISAEAPGFEASDFSVELRGNQLILQAKHSKEDKKDQSESFTSTEFYRGMTIPDHVARDKIEAAYQKGILTVTLPKTPEGKGRKIEVKG